MPAQPDFHLFVHFFDNDPGQPFTRWAEFMVKAAELARDGVKAAYGPPPRFTYAVGTSNGGYQVRRAVEIAPKLFDGGVDWEGTFVDEHAPNILTDLPPAILNFPDYAASGFSPASTAAKNIQAAGYPPDIVVAGTASPSLWGLYNGAVLGSDAMPVAEAPRSHLRHLRERNRNLQLREPAVGLGRRRAARSLCDDRGHPAAAHHRRRHHGRAAADRPPRPRLRAQGRGRRGSDDHGDEANGGDKHRPAYRLYEVQNGNHIETYQDIFAQLELIEPHAQRAFDLLVGQVERGAALPPDQCIPRGGEISGTPAQPGHCASLFAP